MGRKPTSAVALACTGGLLASCGSVWHPEGSGFSSIGSGDDLQAQWVSLQTKYAGDGDAVAADLAARGATCTARAASLGRSAMKYCTYFFCKGSWLQQLSWSVPQKYATRSLNSGSTRFGRDSDAPAFIDYTFATHGQCRDKGKLMDSQQAFVLGNGSKTAGGEMTVN